jgi:hypothetical protein
MRFLKQLLAVAAVFFVGGQVVALVQGLPLLTLPLGIAVAVLAVLTYAWVVRRTERREPTEVARAEAVAATRRGVLIGVGMCVVVIVTSRSSATTTSTAWGR